MPQQLAVHPHTVHVLVHPLLPVTSPLLSFSLCPCCSNNLTDLPDGLDGLPYIRTLRMKYNQLRRLPAVIPRFPQLTHLELSGNQIAKLDSSIGAMTSLKELDLSGNMLTELPAAICNLPRLEVGFMIKCPIAGWEGESIEASFDEWCLQDCCQGVPFVTMWHSKL